MQKGYYLPTEGRVTINSKSPDRARSEIAIIPEDIDLIEYLTLEDNIKYFMEFYNILINTDEYSALLTRYELVKEKYKYVYEASKGTLRKTQIVIGFLMKPKLLLADEPLDGVDVHSSQVFYEDIKILSNTTGSLILFSLHDEDALKRNCNRLIYL